MTKARRRGSAFEREFCDWLTTVGWPDAERRVMGGTLDRGDVAGVRGWTLELKATRYADLGPAMREAKKESENAGTTKYALVKKWANHGVDESFVILPAWLWAEIVAD